jgi:ribonuclease P protein subunit RPR2
MKKYNVGKIAAERIKKLFELAKKEKNGRAKRYVQLARRIAEKTRTRIPREIKRSFCRKCNSLFNSKNLRVRIAKKEKKYYSLKTNQLCKKPLATFCKARITK